MGNIGPLCDRLEALRPAGGAEKVCIARDYLGYYKYLVNLATYSGPAAEENLFSRATVFKALKHCIVQHHTLAAIVKNGDTEAPQLAKASTVDLTKHVRIYDSEPINHNATVEQLIEIAHNEPLDRDHPPWRIYILPLPSTATQHFHLAFAHSHAFFDGRCGYMFHQAFLQALRDVKKLPFDSTPVFDVPSDFRVAPALEETETKLFITKEFAMATLAAAKAEPVPGKSPVWFGAKTRPWRLTSDDFPAMSLRVCSVPKTLVQKAVAACRSHESRLTGLLDYSIARSIIKSLRSRGQEYSKILGFTPIDLRSVLKQDQNLMANLSGAVNETIEVTPAFLDAYPTFRNEDWSAVQSKTKLLKERSMSLQDQTVRMWAFVPAARPYVAKLALTPATESYCLSNLGAFNAGTPEPGQATWTIEDILFSQSSHGVGPPLTFSAASTSTGALNIVVSWVPGILGVGLDDERPFVRDVCAGIIEQLEAVAG